MFFFTHVRTLVIRIQHDKFNFKRDKGKKIICKYIEDESHNSINVIISQIRLILCLKKT